MTFRKHFGLDIGTGSIKVCYCEPIGDRKWRLVAFGQIDSPSADNLAEEQLEKSEAIKKILKELRISTKDAVLSLPESQVTTRIIDMPFLPEPELSAAIRWQAEQYIPEPLNEVILKHQVISAPETGIPNAKISVLLVAAPTKIVNDYLAIANRSGLNVLGLETEVLASCRAIFSFEENSPTTLLINLGYQTTSFAIVSGGNLGLIESISTGGMAITRSVAAALGLEMTQAEGYKRSYGLDQTKLEGKVYNVVKPIADLILAEARKSLIYYQSHQNEDLVKRVVLVGGGASLPGLIEFLSGALSLEVQIGAPFRQVELAEEQKAKLASDSPLFTTAFGLSIKPT